MIIDISGSKNGIATAITDLFAQELGKSLSISIFNLAGEISSFCANEALITEMNADNNKELLAYYKYQEIAKAISVLGACLLIAEWAVVGIASAAVLGLIPIVGWILVLIGVIVWLLGYIFFGSDKDKLTPIQEWIKHCYWGNTKYRKENTRNKLKQIYLNYSDWKKLENELDEIHKIMNSYEVNAYWYLLDLEVRERPGFSTLNIPSIDSKILKKYRKSLVIDMHFPDWIETSSAVDIEVYGIQKMGESEQKIKLVGKNTKQHQLNQFVDGFLQPIHIVASPVKKSTPQVTGNVNQHSGIQACLTCHKPLNPNEATKGGQCSTCHGGIDSTNTSPVVLPQALNLTKKSSDNKPKRKSVRIYIDGKDVSPKKFLQFEIIIRYDPMGDGKILPMPEGTKFTVKFDRPTLLGINIGEYSYIKSTLKLYDFERNNMVKNKITQTIHKK